MIYDADTWIGYWPFQSLPRTSASDLVRQMDKLGIAKALVGSLQGLFYKDAHEANRELLREIRPHRERLVPCALVNPTYSGWKDDLRQCREEFGMPVLRLAPDYHGYRYPDPCTGELIEAAQALKMAVALHWRIVDPRGRHRLDPGREGNRDEIAACLAKFPRTRFLMLNFSSIVPLAGPRKPVCLYDIPLMVGLNGLRFEQEVKKHGAERFAFGSTMLLRYGRSSVLTLDRCPLARAQRERIAWRNLAQIVPEMR